MEKKLIYSDDSMYSEYYFLDNIVFITHNDCGDDGEKNTVCVEIDRLRKIIEDFYSQNEVVNG
jgi:hypothetical protein